MLTGYQWLMVKACSPFKRYFYNESLMFKYFLLHFWLAGDHLRFRK